MSDAELDADAGEGFDCGPPSPSPSTDAANELCVVTKAAEVSAAQREEASEWDVWSSVEQGWTKFPFGAVGTRAPASACGCGCVPACARLARAHASDGWGVVPGALPAWQWCNNSRCPREEQAPPQPRHEPPARGGLRYWGRACLASGTFGEKDRRTKRAPHGRTRPRRARRPAPQITPTTTRSGC